MSPMVKKPNKATEGGRPRTLGRTADGVAILAPKTKPTHFTSQQIRATLAKLYGAPDKATATPSRNRSSKD